MVTRRTARLVRRALMWGAAGLLLVVAGTFSVSAWRVYTKMAVVENERRHAEAERDELMRRNLELAASLEALGTARGMEEEIRIRYPVVKPGEVEFVLIDPKATPSSTPTSAPRGWWGSIVDFFSF